MRGTRFILDVICGRSAAAAACVIIISAGFATLIFGCSLFNHVPVRTTTVPIARPQSEDPYLIGRDDRLDIIVWKQPQLSGRVRVASDGTIAMPLIGRVQAAGLKADALKQKLQTEYARFVRNANVTVRVSDPISHVFYVLGEVNKPGVYRLRSGEVLSQALAQAEGFAKFADPSKIRIYRHRENATVLLTVDYNLVASGSDVSADVPIEPGDTINVP
jgi:polysaccharide biosynthesis/export protein